MFKPNNIINASSLIYEACIGNTMRSNYKELRDLGFHFYVVDQRCGKCYFQDKVITIPVWLWNSESIDANLIKRLNRAPSIADRQGYRAWYISHEMAHGMCYVMHGKDQDNHGPKFMAALKDICPPDYQHYEIGYKPKNALAAGIMPHDF